MNKNIVIALFLTVTICSHLNAQVFKTRNVILLTLDGLRWQEVFGGADSSLMVPSYVKSDIKALKSSFWDIHSELRRQKLMPFFWGELIKNGAVFGNRSFNNKVNVTNKYWFSYPGYSELFTGFADDSVNSNDKIYNRNISIFEIAHATDKYKNKVALFGSWDLFPYIVNQKRNGLPVNAGNHPVTVHPTAKEKLLNDLTQQMVPFEDGVRWDILTFHYAFEYLKTKKPNLLFIGFDETDDFAHMGEYDRYLQTIHQADKLIEQLWLWIQSQKEYKNQTTLIITCDHGRGGNNNGSWKDHGSDVPGADQTWLAIIGPDTPPLGEVLSEGQIYSNQIASTMCRLLEIQMKDPRCGKPIDKVISIKEAR